MAIIGIEGKNFAGFLGLRKDRPHMKKCPFCELQLPYHERTKQKEHLKTAHPNKTK